MKAKIVNLSDLKKSPAERLAEQLLAQLIDPKNTNGAIEVILESKETPRKINRIFRKVATNMNLQITARTRDNSIIIKIKEKTEE